MQLHPQHLELGLRQLRFELRRPQLAIAEAAIVHPRLIDRQDGGVGQVGEEQLPENQARWRESA